MAVIGQLFSNHILWGGLAAWFAAQFIKTLLVLFFQRKLAWERMFGAGGMPSAHSATVSAVSIMVARGCGVGSPEFAIALMVALIVMYDAMGVRRAAGEQAKVINQIVTEGIDSFFVDENEPEDETPPQHKQEGPDEESAFKELKEFLGHTPMEVLCGALLGILIGILMPV